MLYMRTTTVLCLVFLASVEADDAVDDLMEELHDVDFVWTKNGPYCDQAGLKGASTENDPFLETWCRTGEAFMLGGTGNPDPFHPSYLTGWPCKQPDACEKGFYERDQSTTVHLQSYVLCELWLCRPCVDDETCKGRGMLDSNNCFGEKKVCDVCQPQPNGHYSWDYECDLTCDYNFQSPDISNRDGNLLWTNFFCEPCIPVTNAIFVKIIEETHTNRDTDFQNCKFQCINGKKKGSVNDVGCSETCENADGVAEWNQGLDNWPVEECIIDTCLPGWAFFNDRCHYCGLLDSSTGQWPDDPIPYVGGRGCVPVCYAQYYQVSSLSDNDEYVTSCELCPTGSQKPEPSLPSGSWSGDNVCVVCPDQNDGTILKANVVWPEIAGVSCSDLFDTCYVMQVCQSMCNISEGRFNKITDNSNNYKDDCGLCTLGMRADVIHTQSVMQPIGHEYRDYVQALYDEYPSKYNRFTADFAYATQCVVCDSKPQNTMWIPGDYACNYLGEEGYALINGEFQQCAAAKWSPALNNTCYSCAEGSTSPVGSTDPASCHVCVNATYLDTSDKLCKPCSVCERTEYVMQECNETHNQVCVACAVNFTSSLNSLTVQANNPCVCDYGFFGTAAQNSTAPCTACPTYFNTSLRNASSAEACECALNYYKSSGASNVACELCPNNTVTHLVGSEFTDCVCDVLGAARFAYDADGGCEDCAQGSIINGRCEGKGCQALDPREVCPSFATSWNTFDAVYLTGCRLDGDALTLGSCMYCGIDGMLACEATNATPSCALNSMECGVCDTHVHSNDHSSTRLGCEWGCASGFTGSLCDTACAAPLCDRFSDDPDSVYTQYQVACAPPLQPQCVACENAARLTQYATAANGVQGAPTLLRDGGFASARSDLADLTAVSSENVGFWGDRLRYFLDVMYNTETSLNSTWLGRGTVSLDDENPYIDADENAVDTGFYLLMGPNSEAVRHFMLTDSMSHSFDAQNGMASVVVQYNWASTYLESSYDAGSQLTVSVYSSVTDGGGVVQAGRNVDLSATGQHAVYDTWPWQRETLSLYIYNASLFLSFKTGASQVRIDNITVMFNTIADGSFEHTGFLTYDLAHELNATNITNEMSTIAWNVLAEPNSGSAPVSPCQSVVRPYNTSRPPKVYTGEFHVMLCPDSSLYQNVTLVIGGWYTFTAWVAAAHAGEAVNVLVTTVKTADFPKSLLVKKTVTAWEKIYGNMLYDGASTTLRLNISTQSLPVLIDEVHLYQDYQSCPFSCFRGSNRVNGGCEKCNVFCPDPSQFAAGCTFQGFGEEPECVDCQNTTKNRHNSIADGTFVYNPQEQCYLECNSGYFYNKQTLSCQACVADLRCLVGERHTECIPTSDVTCVACDTLVDGHIYTGGAQCAQSCAPDYFQFDNAVCTMCSGVSCGPEYDASIREDAFMWTGACGSNSDNVCFICDADNGRIPTQSSGVVGKTCPINCSAGFYRCSECLPADAEVYYFTAAENLEGSHSELTGSFSVDGNVMVVAAFNHTEHYVYYSLHELTRNTVLRGAVTLFFTNAFQDARASLCLRQCANTSSTANCSWEDVVCDSVSALTVPQHLFFEHELAVASPSIISQTVSVTLEISNSSNVSLQAVRIQLADVVDCCVGDRICGACNDSLLAENDVWVDNGTSSCVRGCRSSFVRINGSCVPFITRACDIGFFPSGYDVCDACSLPTGNTGEELNWTTSGVLYDSTSCAYVCQSGWFQESISCSLCSSVETCNDGWYIETCTPDRDRTCQLCSICELGQRVSDTCGTHSDTVCAQCDSELPEGGHWIADCLSVCKSPTIKNTMSNVCMLCAPQCLSGWYVTECTTLNNFTGCEQCLIPVNAIALWPGYGHAHSCPWMCLENLVYDFNNSCVPVVESTEPVQLPCDVDACPVLGQHVNDTMRPCSCVACPVKPNGTMTLWSKLNSCEWFCVYPFNEQDGVCQELRFLHRPSATVYRRSAVKTTMLMTIISALPIVTIALCMVQQMFTRAV
jgi:hypothetical protein